MHRGQSGARAPHSKIKPLIIGHRGASAVAPENTMAAFRGAIEAGADGVEFDVRLSRDEVPVIIHDETLRRTGARPERVAELSSAQLQRVDVGACFARHKRLTAGEFPQETIPTLQQLFDLFVPNRALLYLEIKCEPSEQTRVAHACCRLIQKSSVKDRVIVECFDLSVIETIKIIDSTIRTAALFEPTLSTPPVLRSSQRLVDAAKGAGADEIALHRKLVSKRIVEKAKLAGLKVVVWTVDDPEWVGRAQSMGIDALITNDPAKLLTRRNGIRVD